MEQDYRLAEGEYRFACLVWANEPLGSGQLVARANEALGWKKSTTYTVLKKLCERGILHNANGTVTALVKQAQVQQEESAAVVQKSFGGSLPRFVAAFLNTSSISEEEAADDEYEEDAEGINEEAEAEMDDVNELEDADDELGDTADNSGAADDDLYDQAVSIVRMENKATVSLLQRRLNVGYARAARIMELLEENGIVGPFAGSNPREVLPADEPDDVEGSDDE